ncbi:TORC1 subunit TCO89 family protein [Clavispora lusitaniae]|uniref:TORC1 subunit TCO89 family protein n=1 Tax=Clavispora lusitaniae TaxID=36911 RepID=UPI00202C554F|nr:TORC1 subunit TCO89 family protein [Clavispora lusitaniae]
MSLPANSANVAGLHHQETSPDLHISRAATKTPPGKKNHSRRAPHARSQSHTKMPIKLSTSASGSKPHLNRSKSSDGILRTGRAGIRSNRSFTKLSGLHPLTKTLSNGSMSRATGGLVPLTKTLSNGSLKGLAPLTKTLSNGSAKQNVESTTLRMPQRAITSKDLSQNVASQDLSQNVPSQDLSQNIIQTTNKDIKNEYETWREPADREQKNRNDAASVSTENSDDLSSALYSGSLLLSQSTGLTRKVGPVSRIYEGKEDVGAEESKTESYQPNQTIFSNLQRTNTQFLNSIRQPAPPEEKKPAVDQFNQSLGADSSKSFSAFLNSSQSGHNNIETRTQQRLWLQRENSMMEIPSVAEANKNFSSYSLNKLMFAHNYNNSATNVRDAAGFSLGSMPEAQSQGEKTPTPSESVTNLFYLIQGGHQNSIQSRTEFERLNRDYVNVRRYLNPVAESLSRLEKKKDGELEVQKRRQKKNGYTHAANTFHDFSPNWDEKQEEADALVNQMWQAALISSSSSSSLSLQEKGRQAVPRNPTAQARSVAPMTRAVKLSQTAGSQR